MDMCNPVLTVELNCEIDSFNNPDKGAVGHQIVHRALWEYLQEINTEDEASADKKRQELFERFADFVLFDDGLFRDIRCADAGTVWLAQLPGTRGRNGSYQGRQSSRTRIPRVRNS